MDNQNYFYYRKFSLTIISANSLPNVRKRFKSKVYARVSFCDDKETEQRTKPDKKGDLNPSWNQRVNYKILESGVEQCGLQLVIKLYCQRAFGDRYVGEVHKSMKELFDDGSSNTLTLPILKGSAETDGRLTFSHEFGNKMQKKKPGFWKKILVPGAYILLRVVGVVTLGVDLQLRLRYNGTKFVDPDKLNT